MGDGGRNELRPLQKFSLPCQGGPCIQFGLAEQLLWVLCRWGARFLRHLRQNARDQRRWRCNLFELGEERINIVFKHRYGGHIGIYRILRKWLLHMAHIVYPLIFF